MKIRFRHDYPTNSTRFLFPFIAVQGWRDCFWKVVAGWWTWRVEMETCNNKITGA